MRLLPILTLIFVMVASSCKKNRNSDFPVVNVDEYVYLNNPSNFALTSPGGWIYHQGGYRGLIVYRSFINNDQNDFVVFDRACPEHFQEDCSTLQVTSDNTFLQCSCNGEKYLILDGSPADGATLGMQQYGTNFSGNVLRVFN